MVRLVEYSPRDHPIDPIQLDCHSSDSILSKVSIDLLIERMDFSLFFKDGLLYVSGIDILDGTPIVDIKPYIEKYDFPEIAVSEESHPNNQRKDTTNESKQAVPPHGWVDGSVVSDVSVEFTPKSLEQLKRFHKLEETNKCDYCLKHLNGFEDSKDAITSLLRADPRSVYRRTKCVDRLYYFTIDCLHITSWFDIETNVVEVIKIKPFIVGNQSLN